MAAAATTDLDLYGQLRGRCGRSAGNRRHGCHECGRCSTTPVASALSGTSVANTNVLTVNASNAAITSIDAALQQIDTTGAQLGAYQARFQAAVTGLQTASTNLTCRAQLDRGYRLRCGDLAADQGADPAAGEHRDGGAGQHDSAERADPAQQAGVMRSDVRVEVRQGGGRKAPALRRFA